MPSETPPAYVGGDQFQREKNRLFAREWLVYCAAAQLGATGEFIHQTVGGWPLVALRHPDGGVRGFRNQCRHQNMPLLDQPQGCVELLRCRFHGWTYDLAGALVATPPMVAPDDPASAEHHLQRVQSRETGGLVLLRVEPDSGEPAAPAPLALPFAEARSADVDCNWKPLVETLLAEGAWEFEWPLRFRRELGEATVLRLILPRSFTRTRAIDLVFGSANAARPVALGEEEKARAVALQRAFTAGAAPPAAPSAVLAFRDRLAAACNG